MIPLTPTTFDDFEVALSRHNQKYVVAVVAPSSQSNTVTIPARFPSRELHRLVQHVLNSMIAATRQRGSPARGLPRGIRRLLRTEADGAVFQRCGKQLFANLLPDADLLRLFKSSAAAARQQKRGLRVRLRFDDSELSALPWELLHADRVLGLSEWTPIVRDVDSDVPLSSSGFPRPLRVLVIACSPHGLPALAVADEVSLLKEKLASQPVELTVIRDASFEALADVQYREQGIWHVVHLIGHARFNDDDRQAEFALHDLDGRPVWKDVESLAAQLCSSAPPGLVVLNACDTAVGDTNGDSAEHKGGAKDGALSAAEQFVKHGVLAVVAMRHRIPDDVAVAMASAFYAELARGASVERTVAFMRRSQRGITRHWATPALFMRRGANINLFEGPRPTEDALSEMVKEAARARNLDRPELQALAQRAALAGISCHKPELEAAEEACRGWLFFLDGDYQGAVRRLKRAVSLSAATGYLGLLGRSQVYAEEFGDAIETFERLERHNALDDELAQFRKAAQYYLNVAEGRAGGAPAGGGNDE